MLQSLLVVLNIVSALSVVLLILLQRQDTSMGGAFGGGANAGAAPTVRNPLARPTAIAAAIFLASCLGLALVNKGAGKAQSLFDQAAAQQVEAEAVQQAEQPAVPEIPAP